MAALMKSRYTRHREGTVTAVKVARGAEIFKGGMVAVGRDGYAIAADTQRSKRFVGVAIEDADNTAGQDGDKAVRVMSRGVFSFAHDGSCKQENLGQQLFAVDDQTVGVHGSLLVGTLEGFDGTDVWMRIDLGGASCR